MANGAESIEALLRVALEACDAERAFLVVDGAAGDGEARIVSCCSTRDDGTHRASRGVLRHALAADRPWSCIEPLSRGDVGTESVRALALRSIVAVPVPLEAPARLALVIDSRRILAGDEPVLQAFAALLALVLRARHGATAWLAAEPRAAFTSAAYRRMHAWVLRVAATELPVLVSGESGSGKEGVARTIHRSSRRSGGPFLAVNCAALAETLLEAELFGALRGAYTGADRDRPGLFALSSGGTLLLDEVADMPPPMQAKLLRVLEDRRVRPVGGSEEIALDTRVVAATHRDLAAEVARGRFRADLYHRLAVLHVEVPPLRQRLEDLPGLVQDLAPRLARETGLRPPRLTAPGWECLAAYRWPGNVRELHAALARALLRADGAEIGPEHLLPFAEIAGTAPPEAGPSAPLERAMIEAALQASRWNITAAAARIGWSRQKLQRCMKLHDLSRPQLSSCTTSSDSSTFQ